MLMFRTLAVTVVVFVAATAYADDLRVMTAVKSGDVVALRTLLKAQAPVDTAQPDGATALHWAVYREDIDAVVALLQAGATANVSNDIGVTPLSLACENGNAAIAARLLGAGANPNTSVESGETPLMTAARLGYEPIVKALVGKAANVNAKESWHQQTALMWASAGQNAEIVRALLAAGADLKSRSSVATQVINDAPGGGYGIKLTNADFAETKRGGFTSLLFAARTGSVESARLLLDAGADVNDQAADGTSALIVAGHSGNGKVASLLVERGANVNVAVTGFTALHSAVLRGESGLVRLLIGRGANLNARITKPQGNRRGSADFSLGIETVGATPLHLAAGYLELDALRALIEAGADPSVPGPGGAGLLASAVGTRRYDKTGGQFRGVRDDPRRRRGLSSEEARRLPEGEREEALILEAVKIVAALKVDLNAPDTAGDTALHSAARQSLNSVIALLAENGADVNVRNKKNQSPLTVSQLPNAFNLDGSVASRPDQSTADLLRKLGGTEDTAKTQQE